MKVKNNIVNKKGARESEREREADREKRKFTWINLVYLCLAK